jgi:hypothetical protein
MERSRHGTWWQDPRGVQAMGPWWVQGQRKSLPPHLSLLGCRNWRMDSNLPQTPATSNSTQIWALFTSTERNHFPTCRKETGCANPSCFPDEVQVARFPPTAFIESFSILRAAQRRSRCPVNEWKEWKWRNYPWKKKGKLHLPFVNSWNKLLLIALSSPHCANDRGLHLFLHSQRTGLPVIRSLEWWSVMVRPTSATNLQSMDAIWSRTI